MRLDQSVSSYGCAMVACDCLRHLMYEWFGSAQQQGAYKFCAQWHPVRGVCDEQATRWCVGPYAWMKMKRGVYRIQRSYSFDQFLVGVIDTLDPEVVSLFTLL